MIDSHAHLIWSSFAEDLPEVMERAAAENINKFVHPCVELSDFSQMEALRANFPQVFLAAGVHPCHVGSWQFDNQKENNLSSSDFISENSQKIVAIGETGLDALEKPFSLDQQEVVFREQCRLANQLKLPLIVHCREAFERTLQVLRTEKVSNGGVIHCYTSDAKTAEEFWKLGFYVSFSACLTFENQNSLKLREEAKKIPLERVLIETDSPFLVPKIKRKKNKRNEPAFISETARTLADLLSEELDYIDRITSENAEKLFSI